MDSHLKKSGDSFPGSIGGSSKIYQSWKICVIKEIEGEAPIYKLNIGTKKFNVLVMGGLIINLTCKNSVVLGNQCHLLLQNKNLNTSHLFLLSQVIIAFNSFRQLNQASVINPLIFAIAQTNLKYTYVSRSATSFTL